MKYLLLVLCLGVYLGAPLQAADDSREQHKVAVAWIKSSLSAKKKLLSSAKRVKNEKSADKFAKDVERVYKSLGVEGRSTAMGTSAPAEAPTGEIYTEEALKKAKMMKKLNDALDKETERIEALNLESSELSKALKQLKKIRDLLG